MNREDLTPLLEPPAEVEKTSAWSEEELTGGRIPTDEPPKVPEWCASFPPGETFVANGWECKTLHIGMEDGHWLMLVQPERLLGKFVPRSRAMKRAAFKQLVRKVGKKKARVQAKDACAKCGVVGYPAVELVHISRSEHKRLASVTV